jgi:hypothetical protein
MAIKLTCVHPHAGFDKGQEVTDQAKVKEILANGRSEFFVKVAIPDSAASPAPAPVAAPAPSSNQS